MADVVVWLRKRLVGGGKCIGALFRGDTLWDVAVVEVFDAVMDTEYPRAREECGPDIKSRASESMGDDIICRDCSLGFGILRIGSTAWPLSIIATDAPESWRDLSCGEG